jgi:branched-chain amino acid transport system substrate-binding protein
VPNNNQQASSLVEEICKKQNLSPIGIISDQEYDSQSAMKSLLKKIKMVGKPDPVQFSINNSDQDLTYILNQLINADLKALVMLVKPVNAVKIIKLIQSKKANFSLFSTGSILNDNDVSNSDMKVIESEVRVSSTQRIKSKQISFNEKFQKQFGNIPGPVATYAYDGMNLLIESIKKTGLEREKIQKAMSEIHYEGVTGLIQFDQKGNRSGSIILTPIKDGTPSILEK